MSSTTTLFVEKELHKKANAASGAKNYALTPLDFEVYGPDDRRVDEALAKDAKLAAELEKSCRKPTDDFVKAAAKALAAAEAAYKARADRVAVSNKTAQALGTAFRAFEAAAVGCTTKIWKAWVAKNQAYRGARFLPVVMQWDVEFTEPRAAREDSKEMKEVEAAAYADVKRLRSAVVAAAKKVDGRLATYVADIKVLQQAVDSVDPMLRAIEKAYETQVRESQKDDPSTAAEDEPDEDALDEAVFNRFRKEIDDCWMNVMSGDALLTNLTNLAAETGRDLNKLLLRLTSAREQIATDPKAAADAKDLEKLSDAAMGAVTTLVAAGSKAKAMHKPFKASLGVVEALALKRPGSLGLVKRAAIDVKFPIAEFEEAAKLLKPLAAA